MVLLSVYKKVEWPFISGQNPNLPPLQSHYLFPRWNPISCTIGYLIIIYTMLAIASNLALPVTILLTSIIANQVSAMPAEANAMNRRQETGGGYYIPPETVRFFLMTILYTSTSI